MKYRGGMKGDPVGRIPSGSIGSMPGSGVSSPHISLLLEVIFLEKK